MSIAGKVQFTRLQPVPALDPLHQPAGEAGCGSAIDNIVVEHQSQVKHLARLDAPLEDRRLRSDPPTSTAIGCGEHYLIKSSPLAQVTNITILPVEGATHKLHVTGPSCRTLFGILGDYFIIDPLAHREYFGSSMPCSQQPGSCLRAGNPTSLTGRSFEGKMQAIVYTRYGPPDVLQLRDVEKPEPKENQVLVKVHSASINALDYRRFEKASLMGRLMEEVVIKATNQVLGADIAGRVEAVGAVVEQFQPGDEVFGVAAGSVGGFAEYACAAEKHLALKPANVSFEAAAASPVAAITALQGLRDKGEVKPGQKVLIQGASGGVGTFAVQVAKSLGAEVTAVCSTRNLEVVRSLGADHVIDYTREDFTQNGQEYDLIFAVNGYHSIFDYRRALNPMGMYLAAGGSLSQIFQAMLIGPLLSRLGSKKFNFMGIAKTSQKDLLLIRELLETGKIVPAIDRQYPLREVPEAIRYLVREHPQGKVVIKVAG